MKLRNNTGRELELNSTTINQIEQLTQRSIYQVIARANLLNNNPNYWTIVSDEFGQAEELENALIWVGRYHRNHLIFYRRWLIKFCSEKFLIWLNDKKIINVRSWIVY